jgi:D-tyrosyl-tRNA(Tyr) deacylase
MRVVVQRVAFSKVEIGGEVIGEIENGLMVLLGITHDDEEKDMDWLIKKIINLRIFKDDQDKMNLSVQDVSGGILVVSQFTLYANSKKGNRPSYTRSAHPDIAIPLYEQFLAKLKTAFSGPIQTGEFGANMQVSLLNDGPVTIILDSRNSEF